MFRLLKWLLKAFVTLAILCAGLWYGIRYYFRIVDPITPRVRSVVHAQLQTHGSPYVPYASIPAIFREAIVATEDRRFASNIGIDFTGIARAVSVDVKSKRPLQGGSTITQQLVHNTLLPGEHKSLVWKFKESVYAIGLYDNMAKDETFTLYANTIYFGHGAYGVYSAANTYFGRPLGQLNAGELTLLAGLPNAPSSYDPFHSMTLARERQNLVLQSMEYAGVLSHAQATLYLQQPIRLRHSP